jgi:hypothetical protein
LNRGANDRYSRCIDHGNDKMRKPTCLRLLAACLLLPLADRAGAEPYLAVQMGVKCIQCHMNPTGGGLRNAYGNAFAQTVLAARKLETGDEELWTGTLGKRLAIGANVRANYRYIDVPNENSLSEFELEEGRLFADFAIVPGRLSLYIDEQFAPGSANNLEAHARFWVTENRFYVKAGRLYLPFGWRVEDDTSFVRQLSGIGMTTPDNGFELGVESGPWTLQLAASNGSAGGPELDSGKQVSMRAEHVQSNWRAGLSANRNDSDAGDRLALGVHAALRTGPLVWLGEVDYVDDDSFAPSGRKLLAGLGEVNWRMQAGHNLKLSYEYLDPDDDTDEDHQTRLSAVYEMTPIQFLQLRLGARIYDGVPENDLDNRRIFFLQLHGFF